MCRLPEPVERLPPFVSVQPFYRQKPCRACRLQLFGNAALIVGNDQQQRRQTQGAAFPRSAARRAHRPIGLRHQFGHVGRAHQHAAIKWGVLRESADAVGVRRSVAHHHGHRPRVQAAFRQPLQQCERVVVFVHAAQVHQHVLQAACTFLRLVQCGGAPSGKFFAQQGVLRAGQHIAIRWQAACIIGGGVAVVLVEQHIGIVRAVVQIIQHHDVAAAHGAHRPLPNIGQRVMVANNPIGRQGADVRQTVGHVLRLRAAEPCAVCQLRFAHRFLCRVRMMRQQHAIKSLRAHEIRQMPVVRAHDERAAVPPPLQRVRQRYAAHHMPAADVYRCVRTNQKFHSPSLMPIPNTSSCSSRTMEQIQKNRVSHHRQYADCI